MSRPDLNVLCWEGYDYPALLEPFGREHGVDVRGEAHVTDAGAVARVIGGEAGRWDIVNLNNPFVRDVLHPQGLIRELDRARFSPHVAGWLPQFSDLYQWGQSANGDALIGICQRFGPFNLVVNSDRVSRTSAEDQGYHLVDDPRHAGHFGILAYDDFNVFHICIGAELDPFTPKSDEDLAIFSKTARRWFDGAAIVTADHVAMNRALVAGEIDFYLSGGVFSASQARLDGHHNIRAITPNHGPIDGKGGIVFAEITSVLVSEASPELAEDFLDYLLRPDVAVSIALSEGTVNPVVQMADPSVMAAFGADHLAAIQWESLEEEISRCAHYRVAPSYDALFARLCQAKAAGRER